VLILEDLHWVDLSTLDLLSALARRRGPAKLVLLGTYRPADVAVSSQLRGLKQDLLTHHLSVEIALERLEEAGVAEYLAAEFPGADLPSDLARMIHRHSGGNPLFMTAIVQDMGKKALIAQHEGVWALSVPLEAIAPVPETLQQMLDVQFEQLGEMERSILERASVAGERFSVWAIAAVPDLLPDPIEHVCEGLTERQQFIRSAGLQQVADEGIFAHYEFRHSLYRQAVYQRLSDAHRSRLHRTVGEQLKILCKSGRTELAGELAAHFEEGGDYPQAIDYLLLSADNAVRRFAYRESIQALEHALTIVPRLPAGARIGGQIQLRERLGDAHYWFGAMVESARAYQAAATQAADAGLTAARVHALTYLVRPFGLIDPDRGIAAIEEAELLGAGLGDPLLHAHTRLLAAGSRLMYDTWRKKDWETSASAREDIDRQSDAGLLPYHRVIYAHLQLLQGDYTEALRTLDPGISSMNKPASLMAYFFVLSGRTLALLFSGQFGELMRIIRAVTEMAEKNGNDPWLPWLFSFREAWLRTVALDFEGALQLCERLTRTSREHPLGQPRTIARLAAGYAELEHGRYAEASEKFQEILNPKITPKFFLHWYWRMNAQLGLSNVRLATGDLENASKEAERFLQAVSSTAEPNLQALAWEVRARVAMAGKDWTGAADNIQKGLAIVETYQIPTAAWRVHATYIRICADTRTTRTRQRHTGRVRRQSSSRSPTRLLPTSRCASRSSEQQRCAESGAQEQSAWMRGTAARSPAHVALQLGSGTTNAVLQTRHRDGGTTAGGAIAAEE
jgi:tetratricopeptide (TPR) repeat protein